MNITTLAREPQAQLELNSIGLVAVGETTRAICFDAYAANRTTGAAILIDPDTNATVGALMIEQPHDRTQAAGPVTQSERSARFGHGPAAVFLGDREDLAVHLERRLFDRGAAVARIRVWNEDVAGVIAAGGLLALVTGDHAPSLQLPEEDEAAADAVIRWLEARHTVNPENVTDGEGI